MYQAATISGAVFFRTFPTPGTPSESPFDPKTPAPGAQISVSGDSAETERAPSRPQPASGSVQRICGTRAGPPPPIRPPKSRVSSPASASLKLEFAWPNRTGPIVP